MYKMNGQTGSKEAGDLAKTKYAQGLELGRLDGMSSSEGLTFLNVERGHLVNEPGSPLLAWLVKSHWFFIHFQVEQHL